MIDSRADSGSVRKMGVEAIIRIRHSVSNNVDIAKHDLVIYFWWQEMITNKQFCAVVIKAG